MGFVVPYLTPMTEDAPSRHHDLWEVFTALDWLVQDHERLAAADVGVHLVAFNTLMLHRLLAVLIGPTSA